MYIDLVTSVVVGVLGKLSELWLSFLLCNYFTYRRTF